MKKLLICICTGIILGSSVNIYPPTEANQYQKNTYCSRINHGYDKLFNFIESFNKPIGKSPIIENYENQYRPDYTIEYLNTLSYSELIDLLVTIEWYDIDGLWNYREGTYEFYSDENTQTEAINSTQNKLTEALNHYQRVAPYEATKKLPTIKRKIGVDFKQPDFLNYVSNLI
mgnify:CR=1 FL=1